MKKLMFTAVFFLISGWAYLRAQIYADNVNINELKDVKYVEVAGLNTALWGTKLKIYVDYGQKQKFFKPTAIKDKNGKVKKFNSMVQVLNFFAQNGWHLHSHYILSVKGKSYVVYIMERDQ